MRGILELVSWFISCLSPLLTLNSRRDGSPFMNLLMIAPLCDSRGTIRYHIGAQVDVSGLAKECSDLESLNRLVAADERAKNGDPDPEDDVDAEAPRDEFREVRAFLPSSSTPKMC